MGENWRARAPKFEPLKPDVRYLMDPGKVLDLVRRANAELDAKDARIAELEAELDYYKNPKCWHCGVLLAEENLVPPMRCTSCPEEGCCDDCECDQPGCADDVAAFRAAGGES